MSCALGELLIRNHHIAVIPEADLDLGVVKLDGVLGWPIFEQLRVEIDYAAGETTLKRPLKQPEGERNLFWLGYPMVVLRGENGVPLYFGLDTGARDTSLKPNAVRKIDLGPLETSQGMTIGAGGREVNTRRRARDVSVLLGDRRLRFQRITVREGVKDLVILAPDGQLGSDVAFRGKMIVDFQNGYFGLEVP